MRTILTGSRFKALITGKKSLNGKSYSALITGTVAYEEGDEDIYDLAQQLAEDLRQQNVEMEFPHSIQITIETPTKNRP
jgi:hypothetical protein